MENLFIELVKQINPAQTIIIGLIFFYFYNRLDDKIKETNKEIKETNKEIKETNKEIKNLDDKFTSEIKELDDKFTSKLERIQSDFNSRFDKMNDLIIDLYKTLFKKDAA